MSLCISVLYNIYGFLFTYRLYIHIVTYIALSPLEELPDSPAVCFALHLHLSGSPAWLFKLGVGGGGLILIWINNVHDMLSNHTETHKRLRGLQNRHLPCQTLLNSDMQNPAFSIFCELWIHGSRIALLCLESCRAFSSWHSRFLHPALDEFWRCSGETLDAAPPPPTQDEWRNIAAGHIKDNSSRRWCNC